MQILKSAVPYNLLMSFNEQNVSCHKEHESSHFTSLLQILSSRTFYNQRTRCFPKQEVIKVYLSFRVLRGNTSCVLCYSQSKLCLNG